MISSTVMLDAAPSAGAAATGLMLGVGIFLLAAVIAVVAFKILKRSLKMAFRLVVVVMMLVIAALAVAGIFVYRMVDDMNRSKPSPTQRQR